MPETTVETTSFVFTGEELSLIAEMLDVGPLFSWDEPTLDEAGWDAVYRALRARGVLEQVLGDDNAPTVSITASLRPLLGVAFFATRATVVAIGLGDELVTKTMLRAEGEVAVEHQELSDGLHVLTPMPVDRLLSVSLASIPESPPDTDLADSGAHDLPIEAYVRVIQMVGSDGAEQAGAAWPEASDYLADVASEPEIVSITDVHASEDSTNIRTISFHLATGGYWVVSVDESHVTVQRRDRASLRTFIADFVSS